MNPLELLEDPLRALLDFLHDPLGFTYGWAIVMLTVIVRLALLPLFVKQYKSARRMQEVAPQLKELQRKYKGNRQKLNEELMRFYKENDVNPFGSCLPLVAQLPIFIALYYVLRGFTPEDDTSLSFMWAIPDITKQLTDIGWAVVPLVIIYAVSQLLSSELSATPNMPATQRKLMRLLPLVVVFFVFQFPVPAGLIIYWMTTNLWTCGQQLVIKRRIGPALAVATADVAEPKTGKSRTPPKAAATAALVEPGDAVEDAVADDAPAEETAAEEPGEPVARKAPPKRRSKRDPQAAAAAEAVSAPEAAPAPEPAPVPEPAPAASATGGGQGGARRKPRPKGAPPGGPSRPASRKPPKKRR
ncbi:MAG: YidC/Oxa1 family membrane protein insertase [Thermoleophilia bacterium]|nr:YidC/Oxa1 family membrane protein insertase [Thermoleophilia bacterium]